MAIYKKNNSINKIIYLFKSLIVSIVRFTQIHRAINLANETDELNKINKQVVNKGSTFLPQATVENLQQDPEKFVLGHGSFLRGKFVICSYGGKITIGDNCYIGEGTGIWSGENIYIGNNVLISHNVNITDTNAHEIDCVERIESYINMIKYGHPSDKGSIMTAPVVIEDYVWINFNSIILKGVTIGKGAIIAAGSVVMKDVAQFTLVGGNPARFIKHLPESKIQI